MISEIERFNSFIKQLKKNNPKLNIKFKDESLFMRALSKVLFFNKSFMTSYLTTIGNVIYIPNRKLLEDNAMIMLQVCAHEYQHNYDQHKLGFILYSFLYLFPQILVLFLILSLLSNWFLLFALFLAPLPAYGRMYLEYRANLMSLFITNEYLTEIEVDELTRIAVLKENIEAINEKFISSKYYYMWPFGIKNKLLNKLESIISGDIVSTSKAFQHVKDAFIKSNNGNL